jgi:poly(A) polymerase
MQVTGDWISNPATQQVCAMLEQAGHKAYFVGGCVRNALIGAEVADIDICTDAAPDRVIDLAEQSGFHAIPTGIEHGTVTVVADQIPHEITTFRRDIETDGRRAVVAFSDNIHDDARRRDFTMNALYARADGSVLDPLDGIEDLKRRHVRFIEDPAQRIREDYLRILRFFRFHAWYGDPSEGLDADGLAAVASNTDGLAGLSVERITSEMLKLLAAADPAPSVAAMQASGVLMRILPGAEADKLAVLVHLEQEAGIAPFSLRRLAVLGEVQADTALRLSNAQIKTLKILRDGIGDMHPLPEIAYRHGAETARDLAVLRAAMFETPVVMDQAAWIQAEAAQFPLTGRDLMPDLTGPALGKRLKELESDWIASGFALSRAQLLARR